MIPGILAGALFAILGILLLPLPGIQDDEAIFAIPLYGYSYASMLYKIRHLEIPTMTIGYLGSLKSFLYLPIFELLGANVWTLRLPVVVLTGITIFLFYRLSEMAKSRRAAIIAAFLLASDPIFLMTSTFDWGPVVLEHFLLVTGCYALCRFGRDTHASGQNWHREAWLAAGFFCFGLALWNKAIFIWALAGMTVAAIATLGPYIRKSLSVRNAAIAGAAFVIGATPLIWFNVRHKGATFRENAHFAPAEIPAKWIQVERALEGSALFGYISSEEWYGPKKDSGTALARGSTWLREHLGERRYSGFYYVLGTALLLIPLWSRSRAAWFSILFCAVAWLMMAMTAGAGYGAHHVVLLYPFPMLLVASVLDNMPRMIPRWAVAGVAVALVMMNLSVVNQYFFQLQHYGGYRVFTDAIFPLSEAAEENASGNLYVTDWGIFHTLTMLHRGRLPLRWAGDSHVFDTFTATEEAKLLENLHDPAGLFIGHVRGQETFPQVTVRMDRLTNRAGVRLEVVRVISDSNGRPIFEISRAVPAN